MGFDNHTGELVKLPLQYYDDFMNNSETDAETFQATRGIDTFSEPFEDDDEKTNWLGALGLAGAAALLYMFIPKGE